ncbi:hypothetical protein ONE63_011272 [Megalurothrips usitatus]|uniref:Uncharacterized protein n=1 Tax=Megalurothrips usitatus TaxID=439358 RepID=A0AAV7WZR5_9NEOP|nr:hypothetical protein ONE63_011272 [Megalurothrips usitatus]
MMKIQSAKVALNLGMEHISSKGKPRPARHLGSSCTSNCKRCHSPQMTEEERLAVFETFWGFGDHEKQWAFIFNCITLCAPKRKFALVGAKGGKLYHREYSFDIAGKRRKVCKTMFTRTLSISDSWINSALSHCTGEGVVIPDRRGQHVKFSNKHS